MVHRKVRTYLRYMSEASGPEFPLIGIVDDDPAIGASISSLVRSAGYRAAVFSSAQASLSSQHINRTECLILNVRMPQISGLDLQKRLGEMACRIPIMFATAYTDDDVQHKALDHGAVAFLHKPFGDEALFAAMRSALSH